MMNTCESFAKKQGLQFSTNTNQNKSKTKCVSFLKNDRNLKKIKLNGNDLPWINYPETVKHLGNTFHNHLNFIFSDVNQKRASFIQRNNELNQEFHFANPRTKCVLNNIYNMSFSGSSLWDLFSSEVDSVEKTYNNAVRLMWDLPRETHRYMIEPLSNQVHLKFVFLKRFLNFRDQIYKSSKIALKSLFSICEQDCRSITGITLRRIMLLCDKESIKTLNVNDIKQFAR